MKTSILAGPNINHLMVEFQPHTSSPMPAKDTASGDSLRDDPESKDR